MAYVGMFCRVLLLVVFAVAISGKLLRRGAWSEFVGSLVAMRLVSSRRAGRLAVGVVAAEAGTVGLLALPGDWVLAGFVAAAGLGGVLAGAVVVASRLGRPVPCPCFGPSKVPISRRHAVRNLLLVAAAVAGGAATLVATGDHPAGLTIAAGGGAFAAALLVFFDEILYLFLPASRV